MKSQESSELYDAYYYAHDCGRPYQRDEEWLSFFDSIAERVTNDIQPTSVLDAGCAMGFLVEGLRRRGVEAFGVDVSEYAIQNVHSDIRSYCWLRSVTEPFPQKYDLIVCIEVLEHMPRHEAEQAVGNFCKHSDDILFSSSPFDYKEVTHFNVHPPEYWASLFARQGFFRDVEFDASFITPWAARFRKSEEPAWRLVVSYERRFWQLLQENQDRRQQALEDRHKLKLKDEQLLAKDREIQAQRAQMEDLRRRWAHLEGSMGWKVMLKLQRLRARLAPPGSLRDCLIEDFSHSRGMFDFTRRASNRILRRKRGGTVVSDTVSESASYQAWITENEPDFVALVQQRLVARNFSYKPLISVIMPVYNPSLDVLRAAIESVFAQTFENWELCLVDGCSDTSEVRETLCELANRDSRVRAKLLDCNLGISGNSNKALEMAQGEFVVLLDHDDVLAPFALFEVVKILNEERDLDLIYSDHDLLASDGSFRFSPLFKPDWSPEIMLSANYLTHLTVIRTNLVRKVGGFEPETDGAQDWDLFLRITELTQKVAHIPKVLYHWRDSPDSTATNIWAKPQAPHVQLRVIRSHLARQGLRDAKAFFDDSGFIRVGWSLDKRQVSIIIPSRGADPLLEKCVDSILEKTAYPDFKIIIVNNGTLRPEEFDYYERISLDERVKVLHYDAEFNFSAANNFGARHAKGDLLLFLNNDTKVINSEWLDELAMWAERQEIGVVGAKLLMPDGVIQHAGVVVGLTGFAGHMFGGMAENLGGMYGFSEWYRDFSAVTGACMMVRRELFGQLGGFNEEFLLCGSDVEFCLRVRSQGYRVVYNPFAKLVHLESATHRGNIPAQDFSVSFNYYSPVLETGDPYYNPNLSYWHSRPTLCSEREALPIDFAKNFIAAHSGK